MMKWLLLKNVFDIIGSICFIRLNPQKMFSIEQPHNHSHGIYFIHLAKHCLVFHTTNTELRKRNFGSEVS